MHKREQDENRRAAWIAPIYNAKNERFSGGFRRDIIFQTILALRNNMSRIHVDRGNTLRYHYSMKLKKTDPAAVLAAFSARFYQIARLAGAEACARSETKDRWKSDYAKILKNKDIPSEIRLAHSKYFAEWMIGFNQAAAAALTLADVKGAVEETRAQIAHNGL